MIYTSYHIIFIISLQSSFFEIFFIERIRDEKKFNSIQDLSIQLQNDKNFVLKKFKNLNL